MSTDNPLYSLWFEALPRFFGAMAPAGEAPQPRPFPVDRIAQVLAAFGDALGELHRGYLALLGKGGAAGILPALRELHEENLRRAGPGGQSIAALWMPWASMLAGDGEAPAPQLLHLGLERTFGGLADAFGLAPSRALNDAWREMASAAASKQQAQAELIGLYARAWAKGAEMLLARLTEMGRRGESVESLLALIRLWARAADEALHEAAQSEAGLQASTRVIRAATHYRAQAQRVVAIASEALNVPTRAEVDAAYREIQELKRELRRLRKPVESATDVARDVAAREPAARTRRRRGTAAGRVRASKAEPPAGKTPRSTR